MTFWECSTLQARSQFRPYSHKALHVDAQLPCSFSSAQHLIRIGEMRTACQRRQCIDIIIIEGSNSLSLYCNAQANREKCRQSSCQPAIRANTFNNLRGLCAQTCASGVVPVRFMLLAYSSTLIHFQDVAQRATLLSPAYQ